jgi:hypothetical protein
MAGVTNFRAKQGTSAYSTGAITWDNSTPLDNETFTANINELKDITVTFPEYEYEKIDCIGNTAQTVGANAQTLGTATGVVAGNFQNQAVQATSVGMWMVKGTQVMTGDEQVQDIIGLPAGQAITGGYTRYAIGKMETSGADNRQTVSSYRLYLNNGSEEATVVVTNVYVKLGEIKPTGADGHWEREFELMCLAKDGALEFKD